MTALRVEHRRILSRGDLPGSSGGIYNPGAVRAGAAILLLCRREIDYRFTDCVHPEAVLLDPDRLEMIRHWTVRKEGYPAGSRIEDFRCLAFGHDVLVAHTLVTPRRIKPMISRLRNGRIAPFDDWRLPIPTERVEKNWVLFERAEALHCLYRLDPLTIFARGRRGGWKPVRCERNGWAEELDGMLSNSTNLIPFPGGHLGFWHARLHGRYVQGAYLLDEDLRLRFRTGVLLDGAGVRDGFKPGVLYVNSLVEHRGRVLAFYGEGDAHTSVAIFDAHELAEELERSPAPRRHRAAAGGAACLLCGSKH